MVSLTNEHIVQKLNRDKTEGIHLLFDRFYDALVLYAAQYLKDKYKAEDIVQEFFVRLWEDDYLLRVPEKGLASYLFTSVRNACLTSLNKKDILSHSEDLTEVDIPVEAFTVDDERINLILQEIEKLPERNKQVIECIMLKGLKYKEAAEQMHISVNTVKFLLKEATRRLRMRLNESGQRILFLIFRKYF